MTTAELITNMLESPEHAFMYEGVDLSKAEWQDVEGDTLGFEEADGIRTNIEGTFVVEDEGRSECFRVFISIINGAAKVEDVIIE